MPSSCVSSAVPLVNLANTSLIRFTSSVGSVLANSVRISCKSASLNSSELSLDDALSTAVSMARGKRKANDAYNRFCLLFVGSFISGLNLYSHLLSTLPSDK